MLLSDPGRDNGSWPGATHPPSPPTNSMDGVGGAWLGRTRIQDPGGKKRCSVWDFSWLSWFGRAKLSEQNPGNTEGVVCMSPK